MNQNRIINEVLLYLLQKESHGREVSNKIGLALTSVQRALSFLGKSNVLDFRIEGKNKIYSIKKNVVARNFVHNAENYKLTKLIGRYPLLEPIVSEILKQGSLIVIFGSYAKFNAKKDSDIDVYIETKDKKVKKEVEMINSRLSVKIGVFDLGSLLVKEIIKDHVIVKGVELFYEKTGFFE